MLHGYLVLTLQRCQGWTCKNVQLFVFYLSHQLVQVCEIKQPTLVKQRKSQSSVRENCIQNLHLRRYNARYTVRNLVLLHRTSGTLKHEFRTYVQ